MENKLQLLTAKIVYLEESLHLYKDLSQSIWHVNYHTKELDNKEGMVGPVVRYHESQLLKYTEKVVALRNKIEVLKSIAPQDLIVNSQLS